MAFDLQKGLRKISEAQSAVICAEVTERAQKAKLAEKALQENGAKI